MTDFQLICRAILDKRTTAAAVSDMRKQGWTFYQILRGLTVNILI